jgi:hypothetical protein
MSQCSRICGVEFLDLDALQPAPLRVVICMTTRRAMDKCVSS